ncbi:hypothetical protein CHS0354_026343 [Potamilus streckersoni]|uniref:Uncharacterized protein n=1 Tax=Potamilus streckersoni TaxID=2493646 RepID=A0AAE0T3G0_9BIVA|nr:hypothetical protein CHS0354_026343 [Potamilus streckersoni]
MESTKSRKSNARMEYRKRPPSTENDTPNMEESSKPVCENMVGDLTQKTKYTLESQKRETDIVRKCLQKEQEFKKEYVEALGERKINDL